MRDKAEAKIRLIDGHEIKVADCRIGLRNEHLTIYDDANKRTTIVRYDAIATVSAGR